MANKKCPQCAEAVKSEAKVCRFCGHTFQAPPPPVRRSGKKCLKCGAFSAYSAINCGSCGTVFPPTTRGQKLGGCLIIAFGIPAAISLISVMFHGGSVPKPTPSPTSTEAPVDPNAITPAMVGLSLKSAARDPDSLVIDHANQNAKQTYVCVEYRAKNGFGGMNREHAVFTNKGGDMSARAWNKRCTTSNLTDVTYLVNGGAHMNLP